MAMDEGRAGMNNEEAIKYGIEWLEDEYLDAGDRAFTK